MGDSLYPFIPMFVHQIIDYHTAGLIQIRIFVCSTFSIFHLRDKEQLAFIRRETESVNATGIVRQLFASASVGIHFPNLTVAVGIGSQKSNLAAILDPCRFTLTGSSCRQQTVIRSIRIHHINHQVTFVFLHTVIRYSISNTFAVRRNSRTSDTSHRPQRLRSHTAFLYRNFLLADNRAFSLCRFFRTDAG